MRTTVVEKRTCAEVVKEATKKLHAETEALLLPKIKGARSIDDYRTVLHLFYGFFAPLEQQLNTLISTSVLLDWPQRRKAAWLLSDLTETGERARPELCTYLPHLSTTYEAFGVLYVLEGSTLGGAIIAKILKKNTGISENMLAFFNGYGELSGMMWTTFISILNSIANNNEQINGVALAANETFKTLKEWIQRFDV